MLGIKIGVSARRGLPELVTNGDNEAALFSTAFGSPTAIRGTVARSTEQAYAGSASAKYLCNTTTSGGHYITLPGNGIPATKSLRVSGWAYLPAASLARLCVVDTNDGSLVHVITTLTDQWVEFSVSRAAKGSAWTLAIGNNLSESADTAAFYLDNLSMR